MLIRIAYTCLLLLVAPLFLFGLYRSRPNKPKFGPRWKEHFGMTPPLRSPDRPIWIHAVSVGESIAAIPLIKALKQHNPDQPILITTTTSTGAEQIAKLGELVEHRYMPVDFGFAIRGFINAIRPTEMLIIETELWPNTLHLVDKAGIPITVINARLSEKSCRNYAKVQPLFNLLHPHLSKILCQSEADASRFARLGVAEQKLVVTGSIKFDIQITDDIRQKGAELRKQLGSRRLVWIAASTHQGEDEQVLKAHTQILQTHPDALLILVPRHPERFNNVYDLCRKEGFNTIRRSSHQAPENDVQVYLGDTMGEMLTLLSAADICFMGGSLIGDKVGGHNVLEPAALGVPAITGPSYFNFKEIVDNLFAQQALFIIHDDADLARTVSQLMSDPEQRQTYGQRASESIKDSQGALQRTLLALNLQGY